MRWRREEEKKQANTTREGSNVVRDGNRRKVRLATILPITTSEGRRRLIDSRVSNEISAWLAWNHALKPSQHVLPSVRERLQDCDIEFSLELLDSQFSGFTAAQALAHLVGAASSVEESNSQRPPVALVGAAFSSVSTTLASLSSSYDIPQISSSSTSASLDSQPRFARTVPTNAGDAAAAVLYFEHLQVSHIAVLYAANDYGQTFQLDVLRQASERGMHVTSIPYLDQGGNLQTSVQQLAATGRRYILGIFNAPTWKQAVAEAVRQNIMGDSSEHVWLLTEANAELMSESFFLTRQDESDLARGLHGAGLLSIQTPVHPAFDIALRYFRLSPDDVHQFQSQHVDARYIRGYEFPRPGFSLYQYFSYDAIAALTLAACECPHDLFTGTELYEQLLKTEFEGVSGYVAFDPITGTRRTADNFFQYRVANLLISEPRSSQEKILFTARTTAVVDLQNKTVETILPFVYPNNTQPLALPVLEQEMNLISSTVIAFGLALAGIVMLLSIVFFVWTLSRRHKSVVTASQPTFLCILCTGTFVAASAIIPMSLQEPTPVASLDVACMSVPWLVSIGFVSTTSALFAKTWRLNKVFGSNLRRVVVKAKHVMLPFCALMTVTICLLVAWTLVAPLQWTRVQVSANNYDEFGRARATYAKCATDPPQAMVAFGAPIVAVILLALIVTGYQVYKGRNLIPEDYSETNTIGLVVLGLLETLIIGIPILFFLSENPPSYFLVQSILISICCLAILLPIFVPKFVRQRNIETMGGGSDERGSSDGASLCVRRPAEPRPSVHVSIGSSDGNTTAFSVRREGSSLRRLLFRSSAASRSILEEEPQNQPHQTRVTRKKEYYAQRNSENTVGLTLLSGSASLADPSRMLHMLTTDMMMSESLPLSCVEFGDGQESSLRTTVGQHRRYLLQSLQCDTVDEVQAQDSSKDMPD